MDSTLKSLQELSTDTNPKLVWTHNKSRGQELSPRLKSPSLASSPATLPNEMGALISNMMEQPRSLLNRLSTFLSWPTLTSPAGTTASNTQTARQSTDVEPAAVREIDITSEIRKIECSHSTFSGTILNAHNLPLELWFEIILNALEPPFVTQTIFTPKDIHSYFTALVMHHYSNPATFHIKRTIGSLRLVSRSFRNTVDQIIQDMENNPSWIRHYSADNMERYKPCIRLDTRLVRLSGPTSRKKYRYKASIIAIHTQNIGLNEENSGSTALSHQLLQHPDAVRVLRISCPNPGDTGNFSALSLSGFSSLHTLILSNYGPMVFHGPLLSPSITTLFLTHLVTTQCNLSQWSFPNLENLSLDSRGWPRSNDYTDIPPAFVDFLGRHKNTIRSLRIFPLASVERKDQLRQIMSDMPKLEALAVDFVRFSGLLLPDIVEGLLGAIVTRGEPLGQLKHIVHVSSREHSVAILAQSLSEVIKPATLASSLTITEDSFLPHEKTEHGRHRMDNRALLELDRVCQSRGIQIYGEFSIPQCCVLRAFEGLSSLAY
jgi:hypothetical protein